MRPIDDFDSRRLSAGLFWLPALMAVCAGFWLCSYADRKPQGDSVRSDDAIYASHVIDWQNDAGGNWPESIYAIPLSVDGVVGVTIRPATGLAWVDVNDPNCLSDASIRLLASSGRLCRALGHQWRVTSQMFDQPPGSGYMPYECTLCGKWSGIPEMN